MPNPDSLSSSNASNVITKSNSTDNSRLTIVVMFVGLAVTNLVIRDKFADEIISEARSQLHLAPECAIEYVNMDEKWPFPPTVSSVKSLKGNLICENASTKQIFIFPQQRDTNGRMAIVIKDNKK